MEYSIPYIILIVFLETCAVLSSKYGKESIVGKYIIIFCFTVLLLFFGFRGYIGDDWTIYTRWFNACTLETINPFFMTEQVAETGKMEPGFATLMFICKSLSGNSYVFFQFVCSSINLTLLYLFLKNNVRNIPLGLLLFLCFGGYIMMTNLIRNSISILIFANSIQYIVKRQPKKYFACCIIALSFHISSLAYFPLYFFINRRLNKWIWLSIFSICNVIFVLHLHFLSGIFTFLLGGDNKIMAGMVEAYTETFDYAKGLSVGYLERLASGILVFCYYEKLLQKRDNKPIYINIFLIYITLAFTLSEFEVMADRTSTLFIVAYWTIWGDLINSFKIRSNKYLFCSFVFIYCIFKIIGITRLITSEYDNHIFGAKSYQERMSIHNKNVSDH